jgi:hypothetical protein
MVFSQTPTFQTQNSLGRPGVDFVSPENHPVTVAMARNLLVFDQLFDLRLAQVQVVRSTRYIEGSVWH